jgi:Glycosyl hydrolase family 26
MTTNFVRRVSRRTFIGFAAATAMFVAATTTRTASAEVPLGVYEGAGCPGAERLADFQAWLGRRPDRVLEFMTWQTMVENSPWSMNCWKAAGIQSITYSLPMLPEDGSATLAQGAAGRFDGIFRNVATTLVARGYPTAVIRIGWEFNGEWYAWAASKDPASWIAYWRRIVTTMRSVPGAKFKFDWCPGNGWTSFLAQDAYPGDAYVDIIGMDVYNQSWNPNATTPELRWKDQVNQRHGLKWHAEFAAAHNKPISFPEWGTGTRADGHGSGDDPLFIEQMSEWIVTHNVAYHDYWDYNAPIYSGKISDGSQPKAAAAFLKKFKLPRPKAPVLGAAR